MRIKYHFPCTAKHGPFTVFGTSSAMETAEENALWQYNKVLEHDGFSPMDHFPKGTIAKMDSPDHSAESV